VYAAGCVEAKALLESRGLTLSEQRHGNGGRPLQTARLTTVRMDGGPHQLIAPRRQPHGHVADRPTRGHPVVPAAPTRADRRPRLPRCRRDVPPNDPQADAEALPREKLDDQREGCSGPMGQFFLASPCGITPMIMRELLPTRIGTVGGAVPRRSPSRSSAGRRRTCRRGCRLASGRPRSPST
jgi:hypothetical protein